MRPVDMIMRIYVHAIYRGDLDKIKEIPQMGASFGLAVKVSTGGILVVDHDGNVFSATISRNAHGRISYLSHTLGRVDIDTVSFDDSISLNTDEPARTVSRPMQAEKFLSFLLPPDRLEERLGDFYEGYALMAERYGTGHARWWYGYQVSKVVVLSLFDLAIKIAKTWGGFGPH